MGPTDPDRLANLWRFTGGGGLFCAIRFAEKGIFDGRCQDLESVTYQSLALSPSIPEVFVLYDPEELDDDEV